MPKIQIAIDSTSDLKDIDKVIDKLSVMGQTAEQVVRGPFQSLTKGAMDTKAALEGVSGAISGGAGVIFDLNETGAASLRARAGFGALGGAADDVERMQAAVNGLVDDTFLMTNATQALSAGAVQSKAQLVELNRIGATLGLTFMGSAEGGIAAFSQELETVGNKRGLRQLGIDAEAVDAEVKKLQGTMSDEEAWRTAVFDVAGQAADKLKGSLTGVGTDLEKLKIQWEDLKEGFAEQVATGITFYIRTGQGLIADEQSRHEAVEQMIAEKQARGVPLSGPELNYLGTAAKTYMSDLEADLKAWHEAMKNLPISANALSDMFWKKVQESYGTGLINTRDPNQISFGAGTLYQARDGSFSPIALLKDTLEDVGAWIKGGAAMATFQANFQKELQSNLYWQNYADAWKRKQSGGVGPFAGDYGYAMPSDSFTQAQYGGAVIAAQQQAQAWRDVQGFVTQVVQKTAELGKTIQTNTDLMERQKSVAGDQLSDIERAIADRRAEMQKRGAGTGALAEYDEQAKRALDDYRVATGLATQGDIAREAVLAQLHDRYVKGEISQDQFIKGVRALGDAYAKDKDNVMGLYNALILIENHQPRGPRPPKKPFGPDQEGLVGGWFDDVDNPFAPGGGQARQRGKADPMGDLIRGLDDSKRKVGEVGDKVGGLVREMPGHGKAMASSLDTFHTGLQKALGEVQVLNRELSKFGNLRATIHVGVTWDSGGAASQRS